jgi:CheY-like chemotaxis protein
MQVGSLSSMVTSSNNLSLPETGKTILLVDDQPTTLVVIQDALETDEYQVITAQNGREALALYTQHRDKISLIMTDIRMPDMDGAALISAVRVHDATLPILVISGYFDAELGKILNQPHMYLLQKPFGLSELLDTVHRILTEG